LRRRLTWQTGPEHNPGVRPVRVPFVTARI
jgi:hypothetical protein